MLKIKQTKFGYKKGNCWSACLASILEIQDVDSIPNFCVDYPSTWLQETNKWLMERGLCVIDCEYNLKAIQDGLLWIATGKSPRHDCLHSVIQCGHEVVHDPHPDNKGTEDIQLMSFIIPLDISEWKRVHI